MRPAQTARMIPWLMVVCFLTLPAPAQYSGGTGEPSYESAPAADVAEVVGQVSKESYTNYLRNDLYTHDGDERCFGPQHDLAQQRIRELFESFGLETSLHPFEYQETTCYNVVGVHRGISCPTEIYVLGAHYDAVEGSPGAMDNGSGVAGLLESARVLSQHAFEGTIVFIAFDREEQGLKGSAAYANDHIGDHIHGMLNLDCIAPQACGPEHPNYNKIGLTTYTSRPTRLLDDLATAVESHTELTCVVRPFFRARTDHLSFANVGFAAVGFDAYNCSEKQWIDTALDSVDQLDYIDYDHGTRVTQAVVGSLATVAMLAPARIYPDFDGDGDVDTEDCVLLIEHWRGSDSQFDIAPPPNGDGVVNDQDLSALLHYWFSVRSSWWNFPQAQYSGGTGDPDDPYQIATAEDLMELHESPYDYDKHFIMTDDIDLDPNLPGRKVFDRAVIAPETSDPTDPLGPPVFDGRPFTGVFDGNGHTISHMTITGRSYLALFGQLDHGAEVFDLGLEAVDVNGTGYGIGGLVGSNGHWDSGGGILTNCYSTGAVSGKGGVGGLAGYSKGSITTSTSTGSIIGDQLVGGLVGWNGGTISVCSSNANVFGCGRYGYNVGGLVGSNSGSITTSYSTGTVSGEGRVGGLVGNNGDRYSEGGIVANCFSTGSVTGDEDVGGLVGENEHGSIISASFWDIETSGLPSSDGGSGKTTVEMRTAATFLEAGWDFVGETANGTQDIWWINEGKDYPRLWWEGVPVLVVDDFESYDGKEGNRVFDFWVGGFFDERNGSLVGYTEPPWAEQTIVHSGGQSMPFHYDNREVMKSEATRQFAPLQNWVRDNADTLTLHFRGEVRNDREALYTAVEDTFGNIAVMTHPHEDAVLAPEWQKWHIALADLQAEGVDLTMVRKMHIGVGDRNQPRPGGTGKIYIDDIWLTRRMP